MERSSRCAAVWLVVASAALAQEAVVDSWIRSTVAREGVVELIAVLREQADLSLAARESTKVAKGRAVHQALLDVAQRTQEPLVQWLRARKVTHRRFVIINGLWIRCDATIVDELAAHPAIARLEGNPWTRGISSANTAAATVAPAIEPGVMYTQAPAVWALGYTGQGVVVGGQDTGYQFDHPALLQRYRGHQGATVDHDYNWHDAIHTGGGSCGADSPFPCDDNSHGTHTMGTVLGDDLLGNQIGMAPGAQWICARNMDQGNGTPATYLECFEFFLAPYPVTGTPFSGDPALAPDVTTNSWTCPPSEGCTTTALQMAVAVQRAAGIVTVCAAGNSGSGCGTVADPPAVYDEVFSIGAHRHDNGNIAGFSSRGPSVVSGVSYPKPDLSAPGVSVRSSVPGNAYAGGWSGTSMATPHVAGAVALLISAHPALRGQVDAIETVLTATAVPVSSTDCSSSGVPNNVYGYGRLDVLAALSAVRGVTAQTPQSSLSGAAGSPVVIPVTLTNTGVLPDTFQVSVTSSLTTIAPPTIGPIAAGQSLAFDVIALLTPGATSGSSAPVSVAVTSTSWIDATASLVATLGVNAPSPVVALVQPAPGAAVAVTHSGLVPGREYFNIVSVDPCPTLGGGPFLGLCALDPSTLLAQFSLPLGFEPIHFVAGSPAPIFGPYPLPVGLILDIVCFDVTGGALGGVSPVARITVQ